MSIEEVEALPQLYAQAALCAKQLGFSGIQIHAGHGFLLSQFLSPLFNHRTDQYGNGAIILIGIANAIRQAVGPQFPIAIRMNSTDQLEGGLTELDALEVIRQLHEQTTIDLIDISGGTYFPGAKSSSDNRKTSGEAYFLEFCKKAKTVTNIPLICTGGFKTRQQAIEAMECGATDMVGLARAMVLCPNLPNQWLSKNNDKNNNWNVPKFPKFQGTPLPEGGITAWYTMRLTAVGNDNEDEFDTTTSSIESALQVYEERDAKRCIQWKKTFLVSEND